MANFYYAYSSILEEEYELVSLKWWQEGENPLDPCKVSGFSKPLYELDEHEQFHLNEFIANGKVITNKDEMPPQPNNMETLE